MSDTVVDDKQGEGVPMAVAAKVTPWLAGAGVGGASVAGTGSQASYSDFGDPLASEMGDDDDELVKYARAAVADAEDEVDASAVGTVDSCLREVAISEQSLIASGMRKTYTRGRVHLDVIYGSRDVHTYRMFMVQQYFQMTSLEDAHIYDLLNKGRVVTRLGAPTGMGKTTKLPGMIAKRCGLRVCLVTLDAHVARMALRMQREAYGIPTSTCRWKRDKTAFLTAMSYEDFRGYVCSNGRKRFFLDFDVFIFDEPQVPLAAVYAAKQYFAVFASERNSLLLLSATVSTYEENDVAAQRVGKFEEAPEGSSFTTLMESGKLTTQYCNDRTMVLLADGRRVYTAEAYYNEAGCDVRVLDRGSTLKDVRNVQDWLAPEDAVCPRVLVATEDYGTGYTFPVSYLITSATRLIYAMDGRGGATELEVPLRRSEIQQHKGRTGRGIATGSGGIVASSKVDGSAAELLKCEQLRAYLCMVAADIKPRSGMFEDVMKLLPVGVSRDVAQQILAIELPPVLVVRYLGHDGRIAARFVRAMEMYVQPDHKLLPSVDMDPVGYDKWIPERVGGYLEGDESTGNVDVYVPFESPMSLKVVMHTLFCIARKWLDFQAREFAGSEESASDDEGLGMRGKGKAPVRVAKLRVVTDDVKEEVVKSEAIVSWAYDVKSEGFARRRKRQAMSWLNEPEGKLAIDSLKDRAENRRSFGTVTADIERKATDSGMQVVLKSPGRGDIDVESPGGSVIVKVVEVIYEELCSGSALTPGYFYDILRVVRKVGDKLAKSTLFNDFSPAWLSVLKSYAQKDCVDYVKKKGYSSYATKFLAQLYDRFRTESVVVFSSSHIYKSKVRDLFGLGRVSTTRLASLIKRGKMPISQSDSFVARFLEIKALHEAALQGLENEGLFAPNIVTNVQKPMPIRKRGIMPTVGEDVVQSSDFGKLW